MKSFSTPAWASAATVSPPPATLSRLPDFVASATALAAAEKLTAEGLRVRVVDPVWALPVPSGVVTLAGSARRVAVVEDNSVVGGIGSQVAYAVRLAGLDVPVDIFGLPREFLDHGSRGQVLEASGLTADAIVTSLRSRLA